MIKIIGNGLLARNMANLKAERDCLIIGAGVSNSSETRLAEFQREIDLVATEIQQNRELRIVYFSTCSVSQAVRTPYIDHKCAMEKMVSSLAAEWCIYRLPQVVGVVNNSTLISYIVRSMLQNLPLKVQLNAHRRLIDIDDVVRVCGRLLNENQGVNTVQDIAPGHAASVVQIVERIAFGLGKEPRYEGIDSGESYEIDIQPLVNFIGAEDIIFTEDYWRAVLDKYIPLLRSVSTQGSV